jgi:thiamine kinase
MSNYVQIPKHLYNRLNILFGKIINIVPIEIALTNKVYKVILERNTVIVKILGKNKQVLYNKLNEIACIKEFSPHNVTPTILDYKIPKYQIIQYVEPISQYKENKNTFSNEQLENLAKTLHLIHNSSIRINKMNFGKMVNKYIKKIDNNSSREFACSKQLITKVLDKINKFPKDIGICHNDLNINNILIDKSDHVWILDFEYVAINDIYFDLATLAPSNNPFQGLLDKRTFSIFCNQYFLYNNTELNLEKLACYQSMLDYLSIIWCYAFGYDKIAKEIFYKTVDSNIN